MYLQPQSHANSNVPILMMMMMMMLLLPFPRLKEEETMVQERILGLLGQVVMTEKVKKKKPKKVCEEGQPMKPTMKTLTRSESELTKQQKKNNMTCTGNKNARIRSLQKIDHNLKSLPQQLRYYSLHLHETHDKLQIQCNTKRAKIVLGIRLKDLQDNWLDQVPSF